MDVKDKAGGFHVIYLPFKENVRYPSIKEAEAVDIEPNALELASNIVEKLSFNFDTKDFPNPVLQTHWRYIEGLATGVDPEPVDESQTQPNYENIEEKAGYDMYQLNDMLDAYAMVGPEKKAVPVPENVLQLAQEDRVCIPISFIHCIKPFITFLTP
jgi:hypothetical protein